MRKRRHNEKIYIIDMKLSNTAKVYEQLRRDLPPREVAHGSLEGALANYPDAWLTGFALFSSVIYKNPRAADDYWQATRSGQGSKMEDLLQHFASVFSDGLYPRDVYDATMALAVIDGASVANYLKPIQLRAEPNPVMDGVFRRFN